MSEIHFSALDLNLLRVFQALAEESSVTRAGQRLGLSQSAVSHALNRLRHILQDELFVRGPDGMRPTQRAQDITPRVCEGLRQLQLALAPEQFDPAETRRRFTIAAGSYVAALLMPSVMAAMREAAPSAEIRLQPINRTLGEDLLAGRVDLAIGAFGRSTPAYERETLLHETKVWALRADHPLARAGVLTLEDLATIPHVVLSSGEDEAVDGQINDAGLERRVIWDDRGSIEGLMARAGLRRSIAVTVQDAHAALAMVSGCDMAALAPKRQAEAFAEHYDLRLFDPPYRTTPTPVETLWRRQGGEAPPMAWLRRTLRAAAAQL